MKTRHLQIFSAALCAPSITPFATAGIITVQNHSFEDIELSGPGGAANYAMRNIPAWVALEQSTTFKPGAVQYSAGVPEGVNVASAGYGVISQILSAPFNLGEQP